MRVLHLLPHLVVLSLLLLGGCRSPHVAELALVHGRVYTLAWDDPAADGTPAANAPFEAGAWRPDAEAVLIRDGVVVLTGSSAEVLALAGAEARIIDLDGATVLPGLVDAHTHVAQLGSHAGQVSLVGAADEAEAVARVAAFAKGVPKGRWIVGHGWDEGAWAASYPTTARLDEAVPDHPVYLNSLHGFAVWGNRRAFELAGIDASTESPSGGQILRDAGGRPTGVLLNRATPLLRRAVPASAFPTLERQIESGLREMARAGYTAVHEAGVGAAHMRAYEELAEAGRLPVRTYAMVSARDAALLRGWIRRGPRVAPRGRLEVRAVKAYYDGALGSRGARMLADYADRPGHRGVAGTEYGFDQGLVADAMRRGFQVGVHAIGDAGNREVLEFIESVIASDAAVVAGRHRIEHAQIVHPDDFPRFARSGIIASMQPPHAMEDKTWAEDRIGSERIRGGYAWRTLRRVGARLAFSSDLPGSSHDIFYGLHSAITRQDPQGKPAGGWYPEQRMTPEEAVRGYTSWAAYAAFGEEHRGRLAPGYVGDVTVLDVDPFVLGSTEPARLLDGRVRMTIVGGEIVHEATGDEPRTVIVARSDRENGGCCRCEREAYAHRIE